MHIFNFNKSILNFQLSRTVQNTSLVFSMKILRILFIIITVSVFASYLHHVWSTCSKQRNVMHLANPEMISREYERKWRHQDNFIRSIMKLRIIFLLCSKINIYISMPWPKTQRHNGNVREEARCAPSLTVTANNDTPLRAICTTPATFFSAQLRCSCANAIHGHHLVPHALAFFLLLLIFVDSRKSLCVRCVFAHGGSFSVGLFTSSRAILRIRIYIKRS